MSQALAVIVSYKFKADVAEPDIHALLREHRRTVLAEGLGTARQPWVLQSLKDPRQYLEIFEWKDEAAGRGAAGNPHVFAVWTKFGQMCEKVGMSLGKIAEASQEFAHFRPVEV